MVLLDPDPFLNELHKMYDRNKKSGTVWITMKRTNMKPRKSKKTSSAEHVCLVRANDGKRHVSTTLTAAQYPKFSQSMVVIMKAHMDSLKKKEKQQKEKVK